MDIYLAFLIGLAIGIVVIMVIWFKSKREMKELFRAISSEALSKNTDDFLKLARESLTSQTQIHQKELENKK